MGDDTKAKKPTKPKYRAEFLKRLRVVWQEEFPFLAPAKPGVLGEYRKSDSAFTIAPALSKHHKFVHLWVDFNPNTEPGPCEIQRDTRGARRLRRFAGQLPPAFVRPKPCVR